MDSAVVFTIFVERGVTTCVFLNLLLIRFIFLMGEEIFLLTFTQSTEHNIRDVVVRLISVFQRNIKFLSQFESSISSV